GIRRECDRLLAAPRPDTNATADRCSLRRTGRRPRRRTKSTSACRRSYHLPEAARCGGRCCLRFAEARSATTRRPWVLRVYACVSSSGRRRSTWALFENIFRDWQGREDTGPACVERQVRQDLGG